MNFSSTGLQAFFKTRWKFCVTIPTTCTDIHRANTCKSARLINSSSSPFHNPPIPLSSLTSRSHLCSSFWMPTSPAAKLSSSQINSHWQLPSTRRRNGCDKACIVDVIKEDSRTRLTFEIHLAENSTHSLLLQSQGNRRGR